MLEEGSPLEPSQRGLCNGADGGRTGDAIIDDEDIKNKGGVGGIWVCRRAERQRDYEVFVLTGRQLGVAGKVKSSLLVPF